MAATWAPQRERWLIRRIVRFRADGTVLEGETIEVAAPTARRLVGQGLAEIVSRRIASAHE